MKTDHYRQCASALVWRASDHGPTEFLLVHKPRKNDDWQLPQGGIESAESVIEAAQRELMEEAGLPVTVLGVSRQTYQYDFSPSFRRERPDDVCGQMVHFVFAISAPEQTVTVDRREIDRFAWVTLETLPRYVRRAEYLHFIEGLVKEGKEVMAKASYSLK